MQFYPKILSVQNCLQRPIFKIGLLLNQRTTHNLHVIIKVTFAHITYVLVLRASLCKFRESGDKAEVSNLFLFYQNSLFVDLFAKIA